MKSKLLNTLPIKMLIILKITIIIMNKTITMVLSTTNITMILILSSTMNAQLNSRMALLIIKMRMLFLITTANNSYSTMAAEINMVLM